MAKKTKDDHEQARVAVRTVLDLAFQQAVSLVEGGTADQAFKDLGTTFSDEVARLARQQHHARGILLTLAACKAADPTRDIRRYKADFAGGFNARGLDTAVVIRFLHEKNIPHPPPISSDASHWLTRSMAQEPYSRRQSLRTNPPWVGKLLPKLVCQVQDSQDPTLSGKVVVALFVSRILEREQGKVPLTKPKNLAIEQVISLLGRHFGHRYTSRDKGPRLPQLAMFAIYQCLLESCARYQGAELGKLESLRAANRKSGSLGDIDVALAQRPFEAVEVKFGIAITPNHIKDAIEKVKTTDLRRYYVLSTIGIDPAQEEATRRRCAEFYHSNGCEIIVNGVRETIAYYLRLIGSSDLFLSRYLDLVSGDQELTYEHREAWNQITALRGQP